jgi:hypothetical protein
MTKRAFVLREEPFRGYNSNIGDRLIHAGVDELIDQLGPFDRTYVNRKQFTLPAPDATADLLVYAGMPQFGATNRASMDDQAWAMLRHRFPPPVPALNIGCGTGYALHDNRLAVAANMVSETYNQWFYGGQEDVFYIARDPLSWYFLELLGLRVELGLCPSNFAPAPAPSRRHGVGISLVHPGIKFDQAQKSRLSFDIGELYKGLLSRYPDATVICQEPVDVEWAKSLGIANIVLPETIGAFYEACGSVETLISSRVHATVCATLQGVPTLHLAIDGRSDLLTPLMAGGVKKINIFWHSCKEIIEAAAALVGQPVSQNLAPVVNRLRTIMNGQIREVLKTKRPRRMRRGSVIVNPGGQISRLRPGDVVFILADRFNSNLGATRDERIVFPFSSIGKHVIYGPYTRFPRGPYLATFDLEYWGKAENLNGEIEIDVAAGGRQIASRRIPLLQAMTTDRLLALEFANADPKLDLEFRVEVFGSPQELQIAFSGVMLRAE